MKRIGLTGSICSGKSQVASYLTQILPLKHIDADQIVRQAYRDKKIQTQLQMLFQTKDRNKIRTLVFQDTKKRALLEVLIHPFVHQESEKLFSEIANTDAYAAILYEAALLVETKRYQAFDLLITVTASIPIRKKRLQKRFPNTSETLLTKILHSQLPESQKTAPAQLVIRNEGTLKDLKKKIEKLKSPLEHFLKHSIPFKKKLLL